MSIIKRIGLVIGMTLLGILATSALGRVEAAELVGDEDFVQLSSHGFLDAVDGPHPEGSRRNNYIWSMLWWNGKLYAGTLRDAACLFGLAGAGGGPPAALAACPPPGTLTPDQRAEIWEYTPGGEDGTQGTWRRAFQSPLLLSTSPPLPDLTQLPNLEQFLGLVQIPGVPQIPDLTQIPKDLGYRIMVSCDAGGTQNLYVGNFGVGGRILYTPDGSDFQQASLLGLDPINDLGYRSMVCWKGRLWTSPIGSLAISSLSPTVTFNITADNAFRPVLLANSNPSSSTSPWVPVVNVANDPFQGDPGNAGIYAMAVFGDALYLGVINQTTGFQIWKADGSTCDTPPGLCVLVWKKIIVNGGGRPVPANETADNARIFAFNEFQGYLYWSAGESGLFKFTFAEIGRIDPKDRWDLIVGEPRDPSTIAADPNFNCNLGDDALCDPLSGMGIGFGPTPLTSGSANYIWQLEPHDGFFYAGTLERGDQTPQAVRGFDLWRSSNGTDWSIVSDDGFGNPLNSGVRKLTSSPLGLFVGTQNSSTTAEDGGAEVWLGIGAQE